MLIFLKGKIYFNIVQNFENFSIKLKKKVQKFQVLECYKTERLKIAIAVWDGRIRLFHNYGLPTTPIIQVCMSIIEIGYELFL